MTDMPSVCLLNHRGFAMMGDVTFRRSDTDGASVMAISFGEREATMPLGSLQREFGIPDDSPDGRMLALIAESLDYVAGLRLGDPLPAEVTSGEASWEPKSQHRQSAEQRLQMQLVAWLGRNGGSGNLGDIGSDAGQRASIQTALNQAAIAIGVANAAAVLPLIAAIAGELAYIEALRDSLLKRIEGMVESGATLGVGWRGDSTRLDTLKQVRRLSKVALEQVALRFDQIDAQTSEIIATLSNVDAQRVFIRSNRDWLHRSWRAWDPVLAGWRPPPYQLDDGAWKLLGRTYHFLAARFMPVTEWRGFVANHSKRESLKAANVLRW